MCLQILFKSTRFKTTFGMKLKTFYEIAYRFIK